MFKRVKCFPYICVAKSGPSSGGHVFKSIIRIVEVEPLTVV